MKKLVIVLCALVALLGVPAHAATGTITWTNPTEWVDGTPLPATSLKWANIWCASASNPNFETYASVDLSTGATSYTFELHAASRCSVSIVALEPSEEFPTESDRSNVVDFRPKLLPAVVTATGTVTSDTPMHCTVTTTCSVTTPVPVEPGPVRSF